LFTKGQGIGCPKLTTGQMKFGDEWNEWDQNCHRDDLTAVCKNALVTKDAQQGVTSMSTCYTWKQRKSLYTISACYAYVVTADSTLKIRKKPGGKLNFKVSK
tara:strand:- start:48 stop:353 length:306 start_codon:yes stop_codon:yes gene_type:complete